MKSRSSIPLVLARGTSVLADSTSALPIASSRDLKPSSASRSRTSSATNYARYTQHKHERRDDRKGMGNDGRRGGIRLENRVPRVGLGVECALSVVRVARGRSHHNTRRAFWMMGEGNGDRVRERLGGWDDSL